MKKQKPAPSVGSNFTFSPDYKVTPQKFEPSESASPVSKNKKTTSKKANSIKNDVTIEEKAEEKVVETANQEPTKTSNIEKVIMAVVGVLLLVVVGVLVFFLIKVNL